MIAQVGELPQWTTFDCPIISKGRKPYLVEPVLVHPAVELSRQVIDVDQRPLPRAEPHALWPSEMALHPGPLCRIHHCTFQAIHILRPVTKQ